jgi:acyl-coenzyme A synthetase/AMP-(fatty) acid ligase
MLGYWDAPAQTAERFRGDWFLTGDQGVRAADGQITYLGRSDDMMNAGGFRVSPLEVEAALAAMPGLEAVGVTEVEVRPDVRVIAAFYTAPVALDDAALRRYAETRLARYKQPRLYIHLPTLPTGANGKLLRRALRAAYEARTHD